MTKQELASYLADLMSIDSYYDDIGVSHDWLNNEMQSLTTALEKEIKDEARQSDARRAGGYEARANSPQSEPWRGRPTGSGDGDPQSYGNSVSGEGVRSPGPESDDGT